MKAFYRQLIWREFSYYTLVHFPEKPLRDNFNYFPRKNEPKELKAWKNDQRVIFCRCSYERALADGYMHNRDRMVVSPFLVKHF